MKAVVLHPTLPATATAPRHTSVAIEPGMSHCHFQTWRQPRLDGLALGSEDIHLWSVTLDVPDECVAILMKTLSPEERQRAERFHFARHRRRFTAARFFLRRLLAAYTGTAAECLRFSYGPQGKPALLDGSLHFNLSHSGELAIVALSLSRPLGVDVERLRPVTDVLKIARRFFSASEQQALSQTAESRRNQAFMRCWTRKEAYIKAVGGGLSIALDSFDVSLDEPPRFLKLPNDPDKTLPWSLYHLQPGPGYVGALAISGQNWRLTGYRTAIKMMI